MHVFNTYTRQTQLGFPQMVGVLSDQDDAFIQAKNSGSPGCVLSGEGDVDGARDMRDRELHGRTRVKNNGTFRLKAENFRSAHRHWWRDLIQGYSSLPIQLHVAAEILGTRRQSIG